MKIEPRRDHPFKRLRSNFKRANGTYVWIEIDEMLVPIIREMWKANLDTEECCQDIGVFQEFATIFLELHVLRRLLQIISADNEDPLTRRMGSGFESEWEYTFAPFVVDRKVTFECGVHFPHKDIPEIARRLRVYNQRRKKA
jgi:hypothetical protein